VLPLGEPPASHVGFPPVEVAVKGGRRQPHLLGDVGEPDVGGALLALTSFVSYLDRMVLPTVSQPIKLEFGLSDTQIGLLNGLAFIVLYAFSGVPLSRLADRTSRTLVTHVKKPGPQVSIRTIGIRLNTTVP